MADQKFHGFLAPVGALEARSLECHLRPPLDGVPRTGA
jgi:hypothetical protein